MISLKSQVDQLDWQVPFSGSGHELVRPAEHLPLCHVYRAQRPGRPVLVAIHGISRNAPEQLMAWKRFARQLDCNIIAPLFSRARFRQYQTLNHRYTDHRTDQVLNEILDRLALTMDFDPDRLLLSGYSGGAQFCHRYALIFPRRVIAMVLSAPGWFTYLDGGHRFPHGISNLDIGREPGLLHRYLAIPKCLFVGELDTTRDKALRRNKKLRICQGVNRLARSENWVKHHRQVAQREKVSENIQLHHLPGVAHSFDDSVRLGGMIEKATVFFDDQLHSSRAAL